MSTRRSRPALSIKYILLSNQDFCCIYCQKEITIDEAQIEHFHPYVYVKHKTRFYASCKECNRIKRIKIFDTVEEASEYIKIRRKNLPRVSETIYAEEKTPEILHEQVSMGKLEEIKHERKVKEIKQRKISYKASFKEERIKKSLFNEIGLNEFINILEEEKLNRGPNI